MAVRLGDELPCFLREHQFEIVKCIADGSKNSFGEVYLIKNNLGILFALKKIPKLDFRKGDFDIASGLKHAFIMRTYAMKEINNFVFIVSEFIENGSLEDYIEFQIQNKQKPNAEIATAIISQILTAIEFIHTKNPKIIHRDLKSANILLLGQPQVGVTGAGVTVKVCDFGLAREITATKPGKTFGGSLLFLAPEIVLGDEKNLSYNEKVDTWSIGVILFQLGTFRLPFPNLGAIVRDISRPIARPAEMAGPQWDRLWGVLAGLMSVEPQSRLGCTDALKILQDLPTMSKSMSVPTPVRNGDVCVPSAAAPAVLSSEDSRHPPSILNILPETTRRDRESFVESLTNKDVVVLVGPNQVGKSTTIDALLGVRFEHDSSNQFGTLKPIDGNGVSDAFIKKPYIPLSAHTLENHPLSFIKTTRTGLFGDSHVEFGVLLDMALRKAKTVRVVCLMRCRDIVQGFAGIRPYEDILSKIVVGVDKPVFFLFNDYRLNSMECKKISSYDGGEAAYVKKRLGESIIHIHDEAVRSLMAKSGKDAYLYGFQFLELLFHNFQMGNWGYIDPTDPHSVTCVLNSLLVSRIIDAKALQTGIKEKEEDV